MHGEVPVIWFWLCFHPNIAAVFSHKFVNEDVCKIGSKSIYWRISGVWKGYRRARHGMESFIIRDYYFLCFSFFLSVPFLTSLYKSGVSLGISFSRLQRNPAMNWNIWLSVWMFFNRISRAAFLFLLRVTISCAINVPEHCHHSARKKRKCLYQCK